MARTAAACDAANMFSHGCNGQVMVFEDQVALAAELTREPKNVH